jgi:hypothetical protein
MIEMRWGNRFGRAPFPLAMNRNDRGELPENDRSEGHAT